MTGSGSKQMVMEKVSRNSFVKPFCKTILVFKNLHSYLTPQSRLTRDSSGIPSFTPFIMNSIEKKNPNSLPK